MAAHAAEEPTTGLVVLVAEDNVVNQKIIVRMLRGLGCEVEAVANGGEVLAACAAHRFDLVLMDIRMPEMDGMEAARALRHSLPADQLPCIYAMTAGVDAEDQAACLEAGMAGFLPKPVAMAELQALVARVQGRDSPQ
jgi:CheY-like chemotaxis protein